MKTITILLALAFPIACGLHAADSLEQQFRNPPESTKPYCYWYWLNGDITKEGITKDLEAMATALVKAEVSKDDMKIATSPEGVITIPAAACEGGNQLVKSFLGGQQMICARPFHFDANVPRAGKYQLSARIVSRQYRNPQECKTPFYQISYTHRMKSRTEYLKRENLTAVRAEVANFKRFRKLVDQWTDAALKLSQLKTRLGLHSGDS